MNKVCLAEVLLANSWKLTLWGLMRHRQGGGRSPLPSLGFHGGGQPYVSLKLLKKKQKATDFSEISSPTRWNTCVGIRSWEKENRQILTGDEDRETEEEKRYHNFYSYTGSILDLNYHGA